MYGKILVAFDRSEAAVRALKAAVEMVEHGLAEKILVMSIFESLPEDPTFEVAGRMAGTMVEDAPVTEAPLDLLREALTSAIGERPGYIDTFVMRGKPQDVIVEAARDNGCDMIVMGRRGLGGLASVGSVSKAVLRNSELPVLLTR